MSDDIRYNKTFDLVLLSCKAFDLEDAIASFAPAVGPKTAILPLVADENALHGLVLKAAHPAGAVIGATLRTFARTVEDMKLADFDAAVGVHCVAGKGSKVREVPVNPTVAAAVTGADLILYATPSQVLRDVSSAAKAWVAPGAVVVGRVTLGRLNLDNRGALIGQKTRAIWAGYALAKVQNAHVLQQAAGGALRRGVQPVV